MTLSGLCRKPFVAWQKHETANPTATWREERCPDCSPHKDGKPGPTLDCFPYIRRNRVSARLRDGYRLLSGRA